jgi:hypothetical protein
MNIVKSFMKTVLEDIEKEGKPFLLEGGGKGWGRRGCGKLACSMHLIQVIR